MHTELDISNRLVYSVCVILIGLAENDLKSNNKGGLMCQTK